MCYSVYKIWNAITDIYKNKEKEQTISHVFCYIKILRFGPSIDQWLLGFRLINQIFLQREMYMLSFGMVYVVSETVWVPFPI